MKTTYKVLKFPHIHSWQEKYVYLLICSTKGKGNTYIKMNLEELRDFYFSGYRFNPKTKYKPTTWWKSIYTFPFNEAISVEEQILFR